LRIKLRESAAIEEQNLTLQNELDECQRKPKQTQMAAETMAASIQAENRKTVQKLEEFSANPNSNSK
jgi:predicted lipid carrier protein YhbT